MDLPLYYVAPAAVKLDQHNNNPYTQIIIANNAEL